jgi:3-deoxy-D-manno-octulosonate 8-phosphate phosphatase (KDO 8-P phosphatase)
LGNSETPTVRLFVMDVDGTLTDGTLTYAADGTELKSFHSKDGAAIKLLPTVGVTPAIISGRTSTPTARRARELGIEHVHQGVGDKAACLRALCAEVGIPEAETAYVGDDLSDLPPMRMCGFSAAPADAATEVRAEAEFVADLPGGRGAVRQAIEALLRADGRWEQILARLAGPAKTGGPA